MTRAEIAALRPGDIIVRRGKRRTPRVVISSESIGHVPHVVGLAKVGHSWTDPNPTAWYDECYIRDEYEVTGERSPATVRRCDDCDVRCGATRLDASATA